MAIIKTEKLTHVYSEGTPFRHVALNDIDFEAEKGEFLGLIGHTGSGKSTLIQHFNGLLKPSVGKVYFNGEDIWSSTAKTREVRFKVGLVFQFPEYQLFEETVYRDIAFGPKNMGLGGEEVDRRVREAAEIVGLDEKLLDKSPFEISGGQKRRAAIAGVIAMGPEVLVLDEPTAGLDPRGRDGIMGHLMEYHRSKGTTVILVTHSMEDIARYAERIVVMNQGGIAMNGTPPQVFSRGAELKNMGLAVPEITNVVLRLRQLGIDIDPAVYTVEQAKGAILSLRGGRADA